MAAQVQHDEESIQGIGRAIVDDARRLVQLEIELAKQKAKDAVRSARNAIILFAIAALLALYGLAYMLLAIPDGIGLLDHFWGWLISGAVLLLIAGLLGYLGFRNVMRARNAGMDTFQEIKGDAEWLRQLPRRANSSN